MYYLQDGNILILLLCGGDKSTQHKDIDKAHELGEAYWADKKSTGQQKEKEDT